MGKWVVMALALGMSAGAATFTNSIVTITNGIVNANDLVLSNRTAGVLLKLDSGKKTVDATPGTDYGDFSGPSGATNNNLVSFNGAGGKTGKDSGILTDGAGGLTVQSLRVAGSGSGAIVITNGAYTLTIGGNASQSASLSLLGPASAFTGIATWANSSGVMSMTNLTIGSGLSLSGTTLSATATSDNWTASGTTNSTLAGVASVNGLAATNSLTLNGNTAATSANNLSFFSSTTSTQLRTLLSDPTGSGGGAVFATSPTISAPTLSGSTVSGDIGDAAGNLVRMHSGVGFNVSSSSLGIGFGNGNTLVLDAFFRRDGTATIQMGADATSPVHQFLKGHDATGTDHDGANFNIEGGQSTGTGRGGALVGKTTPSSTTGSSANAYSERYHHASKAVTLTESSATTVATIAVPTGTVLGGQCVVTIKANDASDFQSRTLRFTFAAVNKAGTVTAGIDTPSEAVAVSTGTLTATITAVANGSAVDLKVNAVSSLTQTTLNCLVSLPVLSSDGTAAVTEI